MPKVGKLESMRTAQSKLTDCACTAQVEPIIVLQNSG